jgi:phosphoglycerate dehydrogenase-like enzyme
MTKILLAGFIEEQTAALAEQFPSVTFVATEGTDVVKEKADALIAVTRASMDAVFGPDFIERCVSIRWVHAPGAGIEHYLYDNLADARFTLTNGKIIQGPEVADHALALLLSLTRRVAHILKGVERSDIPRPVELRGKKAVVIGFGGVGIAVAERAHAFGMSVDAVTESNVPLIRFIERRYLADELMDALPGADVVFMTAPSTPASHRMLNARSFAAMKRDCYLINVSRGKTIDTDSLVAAIASGRFAGVGLDVTDPEPLAPDHPLRGFDNVVLTPHLAGMSDNLRERNFELITTNIRRFINGLPVINVVDKSLGF